MAIPLTQAQKRVLQFIASWEDDEGWVHGSCIPSQTRVLNALVDLGLIEHHKYREFRAISQESKIRLKVD